MKINRMFLPLKGHYFFFFGCLSPVLPFLMVVSKQLGIPVMIYGILGSIILIITILTKPLIATLADAFSRVRKAIFILILTLMVSSYFTLCFFPPMHRIQQNGITGVITLLNTSDEIALNTMNEFSVKEVYLFSMDEGNCFPTELWDCVSSCNSSDSIAVSQILLKEDKVTTGNEVFDDENGRFYHLEGNNLSSLCATKLNFICEGGLYEGGSCSSLWTNSLFYIYIILLIIGFVTFSTGTSISDAICLDLIGEDGNYGRQRLWGTVGWGLMGPLGGFLVDWYSGDNFQKNYMPAFIILFIFGSCDVLLSAAKLQVPRFEENNQVWKNVKVVLKNPSSVVFLSFVILAGMFDGTTASFLFAFQEEIAKGSAYMRNMKFIQGLTLGIQSLTEVPCMWIGVCVMKKIGSSAVMSLLFFLYSVRMLCMALVGSFSPVWATLIVEILHGPCYGLGYTAIVVQAGLMSPVGTSATVQSITGICFESLGYSLANFLGGVLFTVLGAPGLFYVLSFLAFITFGIHVFLITCFQIVKAPSKEGSQMENKTPTDLARGEPLIASRTQQCEKDSSSPKI